MKKFDNEPQWFIVLNEKLKLLREEAWPQSYVDCIYQYDWHHKPDIYDMWVLLQVDSLTRTQNIAVFQIPTRSLPYADKDHSPNNEILAVLPGPFTATFSGGNQDADGFIKWTCPIHVTCYKPSRNRGEVRWILAAPSLVPLEVGCNPSHKFWMELKASGRCARWP